MALLGFAAAQVKLIVSFEKWLFSGDSGGFFAFFTTPADYGAGSLETIGRAVTVAFWWIRTDAWLAWCRRYPGPARSALLKWGLAGGLAAIGIVALIGLSLWPATAMAFDYAIGWHSSAHRLDRTGLMLALAGGASAGLCVVLKLARRGRPLWY